MKRKFIKGNVMISTSTGHLMVPGLTCGPLSITRTARGKTVTHVPTGLALRPPPAKVYGIGPDSLAAYRLWVNCLLDAEPSAGWWAARTSDRAGQQGIGQTFEAAHELYIVAVRAMVEGAAA